MYNHCKYKKYKKLVIKSQKMKRFMLVVLVVLFFYSKLRLYLLCAFLSVVVELEVCNERSLQKNILFESKCLYVSVETSCFTKNSKLFIHFSLWRKVDGFTFRRYWWFQFKTVNLNAKNWDVTDNQRTIKANRVFLSDVRLIIFPVLFASSNWASLIKVVST